MNIRRFIICGLVLAGFSAPASAATSVVINTPSTCVSVANAHGCLFDGNINPSNSGNNSFLLAQAAYNLYNNTHPTANPDIALNALFDSVIGANTTSGNWSTPGFLVDFIAVKASNQFVLYQLAAPSSSGSWNTFDIPFKNNPHGLSHLVFFGTRGTAVPEPATWAMMIGGFGAVGGAMRYRRRRTAVTFG